MKQFQTAYSTNSAFRKDVLSWEEWRLGHGAAQVMVHILDNQADAADVASVRAILNEIMPDAVCVGASASGNILDGYVSEEKLVVTCTVFERNSSFVRSVLFPIENQDADSFRLSLREQVKITPGLKAVEVIMTIDTIPIQAVCQIIQEEIPEGIPVWGGGAFGDNTFMAYVYSGQEAPIKNGIAVLFMGGDDLNVQYAYISGWKPLGSQLKVTKAEGKVLHELNNGPAFQIYQHYLRIPNDEHLFYNALEFPFAVSRNGHTLLRHALSCDENGALVMSSVIPEGSDLHVTYGDPETIMKDVQSCVERLSAFSPEIISIFDCFGRKTFWNRNDPSRETRPFHQIAPTYGFCTSGELIRWQNIMDHHNLTLVVSGMREGGPVNRSARVSFEEAKLNESTMSMLNRLVNFINTATAEVIEANTTLALMAITDQLTQILNRGEIQRRITDRIQVNQDDPSGENTTSIVMLDLDDFKNVNDTYGHQEGDLVLKTISAMIQKHVDSLKNEGAACGRWGGEEFMILLPGMTESEAAAFAEEIRSRFEKSPFKLCGHKTASMGVAQAQPGESADHVVSRADQALYHAKSEGKNTICLSSRMVKCGIKNSSLLR